MSICTLKPFSPVIEERLTKLFPPDCLDQQARFHEVLERDRKLDIVALVWELVLRFAIGDSRTIEGLRRTYVRFADHHLVPSSFHDRLSESLATFLLALIEHALAETPTPHTMTEHLDGIRELVISTSTIFQVHELLAETYPATHDDRAGAKLHVVHNVTGEVIEWLDLAAERSNDSDFFRNSSWLEGRLLLVDLVYFKNHRFVRIDENDEYFVSRLKRSANPTIIEELRS